LPDTTGPDAKKLSAIVGGTLSAKTDVPIRILRVTGYINSSGTLSYAKKSADEKNKIMENFLGGFASVKRPGIGDAQHPVR